MTSVVIAAHNEATVIGRCLDALLEDPPTADGLDITVVANGCRDDTAEVARRRSGVRVIELEQAGKPSALNAGDLAARGFPRVYLDADIVVPPGVIAALTCALTAPDPPLVVVPGRRLELRGRPLLVRGYLAISSRLPAFRDGLFGRGVIALSETGRSRFDVFPPVIADDLFLDGLFAVDERCALGDLEVVVATPLRIRDLLCRLERVRRGNAALREAARTGQVITHVRGADRLAWLRDVVLREPRLFPAGLAYAALSVWAGLRAKRRRPLEAVWGRDDSSRSMLARAES